METVTKEIADLRTITRAIEEGFMPNYNDNLGKVIDNARCYLIDNVDADIEQYVEVISHRDSQYARWIDDNCCEWESEGDLINWSRYSDIADGEKIFFDKIIDSNAKIISIYTIK